MIPQLINDGVISAHTNVCMACGESTDMWNVLGAFCQTHKDNFVREFRAEQDLEYLNVVPDLQLRQHLKSYIAHVWKIKISAH